MKEKVHLVSMTYMEARNYVSDWYRSITGRAMDSVMLTLMTSRFLRGDVLIYVQGT